MRDIEVNIFLAFVFVWTNLVIFLIVSSFCLVTWPLDPTSIGVRDVVQPACFRSDSRSMYLSYLLLEYSFQNYMSVQKYQ